MRTETFHTPGPLVLDLRLPRGEVDVETADTDETTVELSALGGNERGEQQVEDAVITLRDRGDGHELLVDAEPEESGGFGLDLGLTGIRIAIGSGRRTQLRLRVRAPHGAGLRVATATADVRASGRYGNVELRTASGDARIDDVDGDAAVRVASGDVQVARVGGSLKLQTASGDARVGPVAGTAEVRSASGDVTLEEAAHGVSCHSASGDMRVGSVTEGKIDLKSASGDMTIGIRRGSRVWMDVKTISGDARSELDPDEGAGADGPLVELKATSMSGDIRIVRAG